MKLRRRKHTVFIYCEGRTDKLFAQHLKNLYVIRGTKKITLKEGTGGGFSTFISNTLKYAQERDYDVKCILLDSNGKKPKELKDSETKSENHHISLIWQKPCLEGVLLRILKATALPQNTSSKKCKDIFKKEYPNDHPLKETSLEKLFPKDILNKQRKDIPELDQLIKIMEPE